MARKSSGFGERKGRGSGGVGRGPYSRRGSGGQGRAAALNAWPEGEARPVASAGVPGLPEPPQRCVWSATSWACASIHGALKWGDGGGLRGAQGETRPPSHTLTHLHALSGPVARAVGLWPCSLESWGREREEQASHPDAQVREGSLLASPNPRLHRESPEPPPHTSPKAGL